MNYHTLNYLSLIVIFSSHFCIFADSFLMYNHKLFRFFHSSSVDFVQNRYILRVNTKSDVNTYELLPDPAPYSIGNFFASNNQDETVSFIQCYMLAVTTPIEVNIKRKGKLYSGQYGGKWNIV